MMKLDPFTFAYFEAALWSTCDDDEEPLDSNYSFDDIYVATAATMIDDCRRFQDANAGYIEGREERAGHDFWLTRNGHGAGFWDGDWEEPAGAHLSAAARKFGEFNLYVGDDGMIYA